MRSATSIALITFTIAAVAATRSSVSVVVLVVLLAVMLVRSIPSVEVAVVLNVEAVIVGVDDLGRLAVTE